MAHSRISELNTHLHLGNQSAYFSPLLALSLIWIAILMLGISPPIVMSPLKPGNLTRCMFGAHFVLHALMTPLHDYPEVSNAVSMGTFSTTLPG